MRKIIGVKFRQGGKMYYFDPGEHDIGQDDAVIVETVKGVEFGNVVLGPREVEDGEISSSLKQIIRKATDKDRKKTEENAEKEKAAFEVAAEKIAKHGLEMKLVNVEYAFDDSKILFYFTADGRIDFRELVKDLAAVYRTRIELRQIGVRDETRSMGGIGVCGREFCCHTFLTNFQPVSIKMAKNQNLSLNPSKIYGACGRLMCCIKYEEDVYKELNKNLPRVGDTTTTEDGHPGSVSAVNILRQKIKVLVDLGDDEREMREYDAGVLTFTRKKKGGGKKQSSSEKDPAPRTDGRGRRDEARRGAGDADSRAEGGLPSDESGRAEIGRGENAGDRRSESDESGRGKNTDDLRGENTGDLRGENTGDLRGENTGDLRGENTGDLRGGNFSENS